MDKEVSQETVPTEEMAKQIEETHGEAATEHEEVEDTSTKTVQKSYEDSMALKKSGNSKFGEGNYSAAHDDYTAAIEACPEDPEHNKHKSILLANRAASILKLQIKENYETAVADCASAIDLDKDNNKAYLRRAQLYEVMENFEDALADYQTLQERDPSMKVARDACVRLPGLIADKNEKMKNEMMDKLKDLGNLVLKPFGLSTDNFKMEPQASGGYSMRFEPSKKK